MFTSGLPTAHNAAPYSEPIVVYADQKSGRILKLEGSRYRHLGLRLSTLGTDIYAASRLKFRRYRTPSKLPSNQILGVRRSCCALCLRTESSLVQAMMNKARSKRSTMSPRFKSGPDLFGEQETEQPQKTEFLAEGAVILRGFALSKVSQVLADLQSVVAKAPFRHLTTPGGFEMSVAMTNCGERGWISDRRGYRYSTLDPQTGVPWPEQPLSFQELATAAAAAADYLDFSADACLINRYAPKARLTLHQDKDELNLQAPIVSVSIGLPAVFQFGGLRRSDPLQRVPLWSGDVVVWGGPSRLAYHGVLALKEGDHPLTGSYRFNLTFRKTM